MQISQELVNNELLSTLVVAFGCCYCLLCMTNILSKPFEMLLDYFLDKLFKKKQKD